MKYPLFAAAFCLLFASFVFAQTDDLNIIPKPLSVKVGSGAFVLYRKTKIVAFTEASRAVANELNDILQRRYGFKLAIAKKGPTSNSISFIEMGDTDTAPGPEHYFVRIKPDGIQWYGRQRGLFYALQSFAQLLPLEGKSEILIPAMEIVDQPRFPYRGMHLDVSRHFFPVEFVKKYIDLMSQYKFNTFHWHLTDDQGWRIEIKKYPKLTEIGSKRPESVKGRELSPYVGDGVPVEGFYTQEQIKEVVAYAKARYITVIPEIELPGHASAALAAYPQFGCKADHIYKVQTTWGIFKEVFCPTDETFKFLEDVLTETIALFPDSPYIHIGGDEVLKDHWKESPFVQDLMKRENLKDEHEVQSYFIRRIEKFINSKGKKIIGWDEILEGGLAPNATVMSWRGIKGGIEAAKAHHDVIMTPTDYLYFDYAQGDPAGEPLNIGGYVPLEKVYSYDPIPKELTDDEAKYILGAQANIWTEYIPNEKQLEYMAFPRMLALSEVLWSPPGNKDFDDFQRRLAVTLPRLDKQNVNYRIPEPIGLQNRVFPIGNQILETIHGFAFRSLVNDSRIFYTIDGDDPTESSTEYKGGQIQTILKPSQRVTVKTIVVTAGGRKSSVYTATYLRRDYLDAAPEIMEKRAGVTFGFYSASSDPTLSPIVLSGETRSTAFQQFAKLADLKQPFAAAFGGYINIPADGVYEFQIDSKWHSALTLDGEALINYAGTADRSIRSAVVPLRAGLHKLDLRHGHRGGEPFFRVRWAIKGQNWRNLGGGELVH